MIWMEEKSSSTVRINYDGQSYKKYGELQFEQENYKVKDIEREVERITTQISERTMSGNFRRERDNPPCWTMAGLTGMLQREVTKDHVSYGISRVEQIE